ncbi:MAG TPA: ABC transporter ATP-binding protein [Nocardioidaceae bacterium]|nr:ABC transporter ATP-binding protein [Nocardioidaceae bacterium]
MPELTVRNLAKSFNGQPALRGVSFTVADGEFFTLLGPSGCGKSTTLMSVAGLERPDEGTVRVGDTTFVDTATRHFTPPEERELGVVFQSYALWPHMTVAQNLALPLKLRKVGSKDRERIIDETLTQVGLEQLRGRYPHQLSGGQQQRVALARALVYSPRVLLLDEPLSNLDAKLRERARAWLKDLQRRIGITTVYVTHDQTEALSLSDRIAVMQEGRMLQIGTPEEIYEQPASAAVADFVGRCNSLAGTVVDADAATVRVELDAGGHHLQVATETAVGPRARVLVGVRSERLALATTPPQDEEGGVLPASIIVRAYTGARYEYEVEVAGKRLFVESDEMIDGELVYVVVPRAGTFVFADQGGADRAEDLEGVDAEPLADQGSK